MDDYTREMMDLKTLVTRTLEKKGVLAKIRAELRASVFEAIEEEDRVVEQEGLSPALLGSCNDRAKQLHDSPSGQIRKSLSHLPNLGPDTLQSCIPVAAKTLLNIMEIIASSAEISIRSISSQKGRLLTAIICEYLDWAQLSHTLKVYLPECNLPKDSWKSELKEFSSRNGYDLNRNGDNGPLLLDVLEGFLKYENLSQGRASNRRFATADAGHNRRPMPSSVAGGLAPLGRPLAASQSSDRRAGPSASGYRNDDYNWRYGNDELPEDVIRTSSALENMQLDRKARHLTTSWRNVEDGNSEKDLTE